MRRPWRFLFRRAVGRRAVGRRALGEEIIWPNNHDSSSDSEHEAFIDPMTLHVSNVPNDVTETEMVDFFENTAEFVVDYHEVDEDGKRNGKKTVVMGFETSEARRYASRNFKEKKLKGTNVKLNKIRSRLVSYRITGFDTHMTIGSIRQQIIDRFEPYGRIVKVYFKDPDINLGFCHLYLERNEVDMDPFLQEIPASPGEPLNTESRLMKRHEIPILIGGTEVRLEVCDMKLRVNTAVLAQEDEV